MGPLAGLRVLDCTWVLSGPYCTMTLCDLGADVIKVERPPWGDVARTTGPHINGQSCYFFSVNRGKRSVVIDLKSPAGRELFLRLVERSDVVVQNYTPGTMDSLDLGWHVLRARNPRLVYCSVSGFGETGPDRERPALDVIVQGMGGVMTITGHPGGPPTRPGLSLGDIAAGLYATIGILAALQERERSGEGQLIDISMLDCQVAILENAFVRYFASGQVPGPIGTRHPQATPFQAFPTKDGWMTVALAWGTGNQWEMLCALLGLTELIDDPRFDTSARRTAHHAELEPLLSEAFRQRPTAEWVAELDVVGIPCGPVHTIAQAAEYPQVLARDMLRDVPHPSGFSLRLPNTPVKLSRTPGGVRGASPILGVHTEDVLREVLGCDDDEVARLWESGALGPRELPPLVLE